MATLAHKKGRGIIQFPAIGGRGRKTIRLGKISRKGAELVRSHVDELIAHNITRHALPRETASWLSDIADKMHTKLSHAGLVPRRAVAKSVELASHLDGYISSRTDLKERSSSNLKQVRNWLVEHFGERRDIRTINRGEMGDWHRFIKTKLSPATVSAHVIKARQMFADAVDRDIIDDNPVDKIKAGSQANADRQEYISVADTLKAIDACPDAEWRLIFALSRLGGLRIPSESSRLKWSDIDWTGARMIVWSPKTEHHEGKEKREVPIVPQLMQYLREAHEQASGVHVISKHRGENLRTRAEKIIDRAGLARWEKLFANMRSSCETDLAETFPIHVVCAWLGNSPKIARKHYLQVTGEHFERAAKSAADSTGQQRTNPESSAENGDISSQNSKSQYPRQDSNL